MYLVLSLFVAEVNSIVIVEGHNFDHISHHYFAMAHDTRSLVWEIQNSFIGGE